MEIVIALVLGWIFGVLTVIWIQILLPSGRSPGASSQTEIKCTCAGDYPTKCSHPNDCLVPWRHHWVECPEYRRLYNLTRRRFPEEPKPERVR